MTATRYRAPRADALHVVPLDDLVALYHRPSGMTHIVDRTTPELLSALGDGWLTPDALLARLALSFDLPDADREALSVRLEDLARAGLVERA